MVSRFCASCVAAYAYGMRFKHHETASVEENTHECIICNEVLSRLRTRKSSS